ncbi:MULTISPECIES: MerR family transcriptional regulator [Pseudomonas]|jgi:DNA-binding transcriptional MerR regulator|uniref:DNA-binding transcriptional regulator, MerR family n=1 Tax=Pseudomonas extremorientalis TaxID=169669 RepID=A0A1H0RFW3_9PSED|nr:MULTISPECIES: MerR family transcriptional regulator [Pseudomonas]KAB0519035.1 MerR family transcriptional regulator [Pseudomonas extremorientalis]OIN09322.1 MerR family transcriptional regulator [Pseudomonas extremorientalis]QZP20695.1 MerR family transcriptional regulator [Pseudomonas sp. DR208]UUN88172.1 MerR family transcriptional regulator [Pseudomonas extremorientalis]WLG56248.1 MerR family transcriptional regulator [Pseudomonas extremorientalis]
MYIGKAAQLSGTTIKAIRHYEAIGLLPEPRRQGQYRVYSAQNVELLMFIKCAQQLGFKLKELQEILAGHVGDVLPWERADQAIADKKQELALKIAALQEMHVGLQTFEAQLKTSQEQCSSMAQRS